MYYLIVERPENWESDKRNGFTYFGLPPRKENMGAKLKTGDRLVTYVSGGISALVDVREVESDGLVKMPTGRGYDEPFQNGLKTKLVTCLPKEQWIPIKLLVRQLDFTKDKHDWRQMFRNSLRQLSEHDAQIMEAAFEAASKKRAANA